MKKVLISIFISLLLFFGVFNSAILGFKAGNFWYQERFFTLTILFFINWIFYISYLFYDNFRKTT